jgi:hypothetical protein
MTKRYFTTANVAHEISVMPKLKRRMPGKFAPVVTVLLR